MTVIHYDIDITPETTPAIRKMLFRQWAAAGKTSANKTTAKLSQYCVFDGQKVNCLFFFIYGLEYVLSRGFGVKGNRSHSYRFGKGRWWKVISTFHRKLFI